MLVYASRDDSARPAVRIVTNPRIYSVPTPLGEALEFVEAILAQPRAVIVRPGDDHWSIFTSLCRSYEARGNLVTDAWLAALAIEHGCEFITADRDFARFDGLRWRHALAHA